MWDPLRPKYPKDYKTHKYILEKTFVNGSAGAYKTRVQNFRVSSLNNGVDIGH